MALESRKSYNREDLKDLFQVKFSLIDVTVNVLVVLVRFLVVVGGGGGEFPFA